MGRAFRQYYEWFVLENAPWALISLAVLTGFMAFFAKDFSMDASADSLVLEGDPDYLMYRQVSDSYGSSSFLVLTYTPDQPLFSTEALANLLVLREELKEIERVSSVVSVLDVPLLSNPPVPISQLVSNIKSLEDPEADLELAKQELANSPLYVNLLLNLDFNTTALQINFPRDEVLEELIDTRQLLMSEASEREMTPEEISQLASLNELISQRNSANSANLHEDIKAVRAIIKKHEDFGELHLGGIPMVADDIMTFVRSDLVNFGTFVLLFLLATLSLIFKRMRWVMMPLLCCATVVIIMMGTLGRMNWHVTVISSNFISLLLILTLSMSIHLIVRYRELLRLNPGWSQLRLIFNAVRQIYVPCLYMALTTGVAFISLVVSGIRPVINFGLMMTTGIVVAFIVTFWLFPALLMVVGKDPFSGERTVGVPITNFFAKLTLNYGRTIIVAAVAVACFTVVGVKQLVVENSFIDYFGEDTEIYQGMQVIDQRLGGTTPLEILIDFPGSEIIPGETFAANVEALDEQDFYQSEPEAEDDFLEDEFLEDEFADEGFGDELAIGGFEDDFATNDDPEKYWFTSDKIEEIKAVHNYLETLPAVGKVISLATMMEIAESFNNGEPFNNMQLALLYSVIPEEFRSIVIDPYVNTELSQARINLRILDSTSDLKRDALLKQIRHDIVNELGIPEERVHLAGMMVLYNNMLQSLFSSQIATLGAVFAGIMVMFLVLFRSFKISLIAMAPNMLAAGFVLGIMGWLGIPLDMMTITIASITIGIAVDNTIHYIVRFKNEFAKDGDYLATLERSHSTIGKAMFYTSLTIIMGFSILVMSNFKPTIYFGLLTALAMGVALLGALTVLPQLIVMFRPFGRQQKAPSTSE